MTKQPHTDPTLPPLSPSALAAMPLPVKAIGVWIDDAKGKAVLYVRTLHGTEQDDKEIAAFIAALINATLTPAQPAPLPLDPETPLCDWRNCFEYAQPGDVLCAGHREEANHPDVALLDPDNNVEAGQLDALLAEGDDRLRSAG